MCTAAPHFRPFLFPAPHWGKGGAASAQAVSSKANCFKKDSKSGSRYSLKAPVRVIRASNGV